MHSYAGPLVPQASSEVRLIFLPSFYIHHASHIIESVDSICRDSVDTQYSYDNALSLKHSELFHDGFNSHKTTAFPLSSAPAHHFFTLKSNKVLQAGY